MSALPTPTLGLSRRADGRPLPGLSRRSRADVRLSDPLIGWVATLVVTALAGFLRWWHLGSPRSFMFDETYYAKQAWSLIHHGYAQTYVDKANERILAGQWSPSLWTGKPEMIVHPEVGKWLIGAGESVFGFTPFGWRVASAIAGTLMVLVMIRLARRLTGSTLLGVIAGLLMCFDGLQLVLSRMALLDIFQAFFLLSAVAALVADRDWGRERLLRRPSRGQWGPLLWWRPWRILAGVWFGLAVSTKWSSLYVIAGFGLLTWAWDAGARRRLGVRRPWARSFVVDALPAFGWLVVVPAVIYVASWTGWLMHAQVFEKAFSDTQYGPYWGSYLRTDAHGFWAEATQSLRSLWHYHHDIYAFHTRFLDDATHTYQSKPWGWLIQHRPVGVDAQLDIKPGVQGCTAAAGSTCLRQVLLLGNPLVWWGGTAALVYSLVAWVGRRDWRFGIVVVGVLATWLTWVPNDTRPIFSYYAICIEPFLILGLTLTLGRILGSADAPTLRRRVGGAVVGVYLIAVTVAFVWFWPIWTDQLITTAAWLRRIWFKSWI